MKSADLKFGFWGKRTVSGLPTPCSRATTGLLKPAVSWPAKIKEKGGTRSRFHHVVDIVATIREVTGIPVPNMIDGIAQKPIEGVSLAYTNDEANATRRPDTVHSILKCLACKGRTTTAASSDASAIQPIIAQMKRCLGIEVGKSSPDEINPVKRST